MPIGLTNALATCQALINNILQAYLDIFIITYLNNILVYLANKREYIQYIKTVLTLLRQADLKLKPKKCKFYKQEVKFLRFIIGTYRVKISPQKIKTIQEQL